MSAKVFVCLRFALDALQIKHRMTDDRGKKIYEPPRYMSINTAIEQLLEIEESREGKGASSLLLNSSVELVRAGLQLLVRINRFFSQMQDVSCEFCHICTCVLLPCGLSCIRILTFEWQLCFPSVFNEETMCVGVARLGTSTQKIVAGTMKELLDVDFGAPLHSLVIPGIMHVVEEEFLSFYKAT